MSLTNVEDKLVLFGEAVTQHYAIMTFRYTIQFQTNGHW